MDARQTVKVAAPSIPLPLARRVHAGESFPHRKSQMSYLSRLIHASVHRRINVAILNFCRGRHTSYATANRPATATSLTKSKTRTMRLGNTALPKTLALEDAPRSVSSV